ncbi:alpha/beta hydrolase family protein [Sporobolomyces salmoneus]|uniref:alpha/beta hydrolase family protein n=1 Tax=Sporobolomyces salmoneus TaxID=183962 RepID=UPI003173BDFF
MSPQTSTSPPATTFTVGGLPIQVYGLESLSPTSIAKPIAVLFLLHGRFGAASDKLISTFASTLLSPPVGPTVPKTQSDLLVVTFDQRNHGHRTVEREKNFGWKEGGKKRAKEREEQGMKEDELDNASHAVDMMAIQTGTAKDVSFLIDFLPSVLFPNDEREIVDWYCSGISLGGHATWLALAYEPRISLGIPIIGAPSTLTLLSDRALNLPAPSGPLTVSPPYFPKTFIDLLKKHDPDQAPMSVWKGRKICVLSGEDDTLVNFVKGGSEKFVERLEKEGELQELQVSVQPKTGHACTPEMMERAQRFVWKALCNQDSANQGAKM